MYLISTMHLHELLRPRHEQPLGGQKPTQKTSYHLTKVEAGPLISFKLSRWWPKPSPTRALEREKIKIMNRTEKHKHLLQLHIKVSFSWNSQHHIYSQGAKTLFWSTIQEQLLVLTDILLFDGLLALAQLEITLKLHYTPTKQRVPENAWTTINSFRLW